MLHGKEKVAIEWGLLSIAQNSKKEDVSQPKRGILFFMDFILS
jgi:hypothetical protein